MEKYNGIGVSSGSVVGPAFVLSRAEVVVPEHDDPRGAFVAAATAVKADLEALSAKARQAGRTEAAEVLGAQALMADDPMLSDSVLERLDAGAGLQEAVEGATADLVAMLAAMPDEYLAARSADIGEVGDRVLRSLAGVESAGLGSLLEPSVVVAKTLTAAETALLDPATVLAFVTETGGPTSHVAVIARSLNMPAVVAVDSIAARLTSGTVVAVDASLGEVVVSPDPGVIADFERRAAAERERRQAAARYRGVAIEYGAAPFGVAANVGGPDDVARAVEAQSDGVGLYRTEFLFLDRAEPPTEEEQFEVYAAAVSAFEHPVVVRTFDIGGDKPAAYLDSAPEENPFLGARGVRIYDQHADLFRGQIRALLRASVAGDLWIMIPMVATVADVVGVRGTIEEVRAELAEAGVPMGDPKIGIMIEVPSAAVIADRLAQHVDFFSIGTNDLTQYTLAADRTNAQVAGYGDAAHPAVLELCRATSAAAIGAGITTSVCGEAAADPILSILFAAMGISKLSVSAPAVDLVKSVVDALDPVLASRLLAEALAADSAEEVRRIVSTQTG
jgi:phosphotransferase system enzyme I (PtsI)